MNVIFVTALLSQTSQLYVRGYIYISYTVHKTPVNFVVILCLIRQTHIHIKKTTNINSETIFIEYNYYNNLRT